METRLTTDQKIPGSTPGRLEIYFFLFQQQTQNILFLPFLMTSSISPEKLADLLIDTPARVAVVDLSDWTTASFSPSTGSGKTIVGSMAGPGTVDGFRACVDDMLDRLSGASASYDTVVFVCQRGQTRSPACASLFCTRASERGKEGAFSGGVFYLRGGLDKFVTEFGYDRRLVYNNNSF